jgi:hypothetical protein
MGTAGSFDIATLTDLLVLFFIYDHHYKIDLIDHKGNRLIYKENGRKIPTFQRKIDLLLFNKVGDDL